MSSRYHSSRFRPNGNPFSYSKDPRVINRPKFTYSPQFTLDFWEKYYKPIAIKNNLYPIPSLQSINSDSNPYIFDSDTYLSSGSTITFNSSSDIPLVTRLRFSNKSSYNSTQSIQYSGSSGQSITLTSGYNSFLLLENHQSYYSFSYYKIHLTSGTSLSISPNQYYLVYNWGTDSTTGDILSFFTNSQIIFELHSISSEGLPSTYIFPVYLSLDFLQIDLPSIE